MGPIAKIIKIKFESVIILNSLINWMLIIVIEKPIQFTIVSAVPFNSNVAFCATNVENKGESAITTIAQKNRNKRNKTSDSNENINGKVRLHNPENKSAKVAVRLVPKI